MEIKPELELNLHPKDNVNLSLVTAMNIKLSNDGSCLTNEESIRENTYIQDNIAAEYVNKQYKIVGIIPCNNELVIITNEINTDKTKIFRYREESCNYEKSIKCVYGQYGDRYLKYHGGKIKGTFTYNVENALIVAIAEYDGDEEMIPLRTINLGNFDNPDVYCDSNLIDSQLSISPEVYIPSLKNIEYVKGNSYKGWHYLFIRYKLNHNDYTQWFNFGQPIYIDSIDKVNISKYCYFVKEITKYDSQGNDILTPKSPTFGLCTGYNDYISNKTDIANETFKADIEFYNNIYDKYQIGVICASKSYSKAFKTSDIIYNEYSNTNTFIFNKDLLTEASITDFINDNYNYFDVKNLINYKNQLYISNYKESNLNNKSVDQLLIDQINVNLVNETINLDDEFYNITICKKIEKDGDYENIFINQYDTKNKYILLSDFLNIDPKTQITIVGDEGEVQNIINPIPFKGRVELTKTADSFRIYNRSINIKFKKVESGDLIGYEIEDEQILKDDYITISVFDSIAGSMYYFYGYVTMSYKNSGVIVKNGINLDEYAIHKYNPIYTNTKNSFNNRKLKFNLISGEVYNFFIHFVDKYGHCTNGYQLKNKNYWRREDNKDIIPIPFTYNNKLYYASVLIDDNVVENGQLNLKNLQIYEKVVNLFNNNYLQNKIVDNNITTCFKELYNGYTKQTNKDLKWYQITTGYNCNNFLPYYNVNGDKLFHVPIKGNTNPSYRIRSIDTPYNKTVNCYNISISDVDIPDGYIGYFISYEKFEPINRCTGILTRNDFNSFTGEKSNNGDKSNLMYFYSSKFDINDTLKLDYNILRIDGVNLWAHNDEQHAYFQTSENYKYCYDLNKPQLYNEFANCPIAYSIPDYKLVVANSASDDRVGLGTALEIKDSYNLFRFENREVYLYKATLINANRNIYTNINKVLIRCSDVVYGYNKDLNIYLNGHITYDGVLVYNNNKVTFNTADFTLKRLNSNINYYPEKIQLHLFDLLTNKFSSSIPHPYIKYTQLPYPYIKYMQLPVIDDYFYESKSFKNEPAAYIYYVQRDSENVDKGNENNKFYAGNMVTPADSIDLFENRQGSYDQFDRKTYSNYRDDLVSIDTFDKTIRRSLIIKDESRENNWRTFPVEAYKNITENKGIIINIVGIGTLILIHTEHSLFMFSTENTLETNNQNIQLLQPDAFDVKYKEVFTSDLGFGGLQDNDATIIDQFGYIFYSNDTNRFYNFDNGQLKIIDSDIIQWLNTYKPYNVRFANDKNNNRLLIKLNYKINKDIKEAVFSYNYGVNKFISLHSYTFDKAYNTKTKLYLQCNNEHVGCDLHEFVAPNETYGNYDNVKNSLGKPTVCKSKIGIIVNEQYYLIKFLEYISYKLYKIKNDKTDYTYFPVKGCVQPYSADTIRIYNDQVDTGELNILVDKEELKNAFCDFTKPYWHLGNWNFNYLRNKLIDIEKYGDAYNMSRLFGNYFIIEFTFNNDDSLKVEFEGLDYKITR